MRRGLTLLEVLVAGVLLSVGLLSVLQIIGRTATTSREVDDRARALMAARSKMEEILKEPVLQLGTDRGEGADTSTDYDWEATIDQSSNPALYVVTVAARNRVTGVTVVLTSLRRPDAESPQVMTEEGLTTPEPTEPDTDPGDDQ
jgi:type II secretion system protein I